MEQEILPKHIISKSKDHDIIKKWVEKGVNDKILAVLLDNYVQNDVSSIHPCFTDGIKLTKSIWRNFYMKDFIGVQPMTSNLEHCYYFDIRNGDNGTLDICAESGILEAKTMLSSTFLSVNLDNQEDIIGKRIANELSQIVIDDIIDSVEHHKYIKENMEIWTLNPVDFIPTKHVFNSNNLLDLLTVNPIMQAGHHFILTDDLGISLLDNEHFSSLSSDIFELCMKWNTNIDFAGKFTDKNGIVSDVYKSKHISNCFIVGCNSDILMQNTYFLGLYHLAMEGPKVMHEALGRSLMLRFAKFMAPNLKNFYKVIDF